MDVEKTMQFILDHQAKSEAEMAALREAQNKTEQGLQNVLSDAYKALDWLKELSVEEIRRVLDAATVRVYDELALARSHGG
jgi:hypothetical protein